MPGIIKPSTPPKETPWTIDELIRQRALEHPKDVLIAYPSRDGIYVNYTAQQLDRFAFHTARHYAQLIKPRTSSSEAIKVVALLAPSNFDYLVSALALTKLGMTVLFLSTRISEAAYLDLLRCTDCHNIIVDSALDGKTVILKKELPTLNVRYVAGEEVYNVLDNETPSDTAMDQALDRVVENLKIAWIIHSSGSTGLPKPIYQTHSAAIRNYANNFDMRGFVTLPMYHAHGLSSIFRAIYSRKQIHIYSAAMPLTGPTLVATLLRHNFEIFYGVPYALKLLSETHAGLSLLSKIKLVMFGGSSCPKELGDKLVTNGVKLVGHYGTTETGQLMTSFRDDDELDWDYLRVSKSLAPFIKWEERGDDHVELVVLEGWPSKVATNRPDGAYATKDLFVRHPTKSHCFKWTGRLDDTIVLLNGEKANPIPIEHSIRQNENVGEAIVFGSSKPQLGLFIIPSATGAILSNEEIISSSILEIEAANARVDSFSQIPLDMVRVLPYGLKYPRTDKDTVIRAAFYTQLKDEIEQVYEDLLIAAPTGGRDMALEELRDFLHSSVADLLHLEDPSALSADTDLFSLGLDSLQALRVHSAIVKTFNTHGNPVGRNVVFEHPSLKALSSFLYDLAQGCHHQAEGHVEVMERLIDRYSRFRPHPHSNTATLTSRTSAVLVTGATGSLGAHLVTKLVAMEHISKVYCLVRADSVHNAGQRVQESLSHRKLLHSLTTTQRDKIYSLPSNLGQEDLGLTLDQRELLLSEIGTVIHLAWAVNFKWGIDSFEQQHIAGIHNLIQFCLDCKRPHPAAFHFGSSVSAVAASPRRANEAIDTNLDHAQWMGYARSKLIAENICANAAKQTGAVCRVHRIGQVVGDTQHGIWNATEAIPLMLQSATTIGALPALDESPTWLPVDVVAGAMAELSFLPVDEVARDAVFHIVNPTAFHWTRDLLPALRLAGLQFEEVGPKEWVRRLRESNLDPVANPPIKLLDFFASKYDHDDKRSSVYYATDHAASFSPTLHSAARLDPGLVQKFVKYWGEKCWNCLSVGK